MHRQTDRQTDRDYHANSRSVQLQYDGILKTRKLSYRKDDRAMRPMYGCPENFQESLDL